MNSCTIREAAFDAKGEPVLPELIKATNHKNDHIRANANAATVVPLSTVGSPIVAVNEKTVIIQLYVFCLTVGHIRLSGTSSQKGLPNFCEAFIQDEISAWHKYVKFAVMWSVFPVVSEYIS